jgi:uncharacterized membrane protein
MDGRRTWLGLDGVGSLGLDLYLFVKTVHVLSATVLFGTGAGIAFFMLTGHLTGVPAARCFAAATTVRADFLFTLPAVIVQPLSGAWLVWRGGFDWSDRRLVVTYALYLLAGACWLPVVAIQMRMKAILDAEPVGRSLDEAMLSRLFGWWCALGWPAFGGLIVVFYLMVAKPSW